MFLKLLCWIFVWIHYFNQGIKKWKKNWVINLKKWGFIYNPSYAQKHIRKCYYSKFYESIPKSTPMILIFLGDFNGIKNLRISAPYIWELTKFEKSRFFKNDNKNFWISKFFFFKLKVLLVAKYHRKSFALTSLISSQWAFKKNSNFSGEKIEKSKIPHNFPQGWPGTVLLHQRVYTNGTSQKKNILSILAILSYHPLVYFCPGEPLNLRIRVGSFYAYFEIEAFSLTTIN